MRSFIAPIILGTSLFLSVAAIAPQSALACACCANIGTWTQTTRRPTAFEMEELQSLKLEGDFYRWMRGDGNGADTRRRITAQPIQSGNWQFSLAMKDRRAPAVAQFTASKAANWQFSMRDMAQWQPDKSLDSAEIHHEVIIPGTITFRNDPVNQIPNGKSMNAQLILQGKGGGCFGRDIIYHWTLKFKSNETTTFTGVGRVNN